MVTHLLCAGVQPYLELDKEEDQQHEEHCELAAVRGLFVLAGLQTGSQLY